jgi:hypothetical protein
MDIGRLYKYGCTTVDVASRIRAARHRYKGVSFNEISSVSSDDIYEDEWHVKWGILDHGLGALGEYFVVQNDDNMPTDAHVIARFVRLIEEGKSKRTR